MSARAPAITRVVGALAEAAGMDGAQLNELVRIGDRSLLAEVLRIDGGRATLQVFEDTNGTALEGAVAPLGGPLSIELGPGLLGSVLDGIGRPLGVLASQTGDFIAPGAVGPTLDPAARFEFRPARRAGDAVQGGDVLGVVDERGGFEHRVLAPPGSAGVIRALDAGRFTVADAVGELRDGTALRLAHRWPVRRPRPIAARIAAERPFLTGQRVFDLLFPVAEGGAVAVPGGFGTGKTVIEQSLAKFAEADVTVYIGCGERGNEMAEVLHDFAALRDPRTGRAVLDRTVLVVNTSNMPVAAREASIDLGLTVAEYFRDMGYRAAVMADSLSRWAEALREIGSRLQEMPGEEGYPMYLASRTAKILERAGCARCLGAPERSGSVTLVAAVSPPGGDFSEPVTQACLRVAGAVWALDPDLAHQRQFPAVDAATSYSLYTPAMDRWFSDHADAEWASTRASLASLLQRDAELREIASVVGQEALADADRLLLAAASMAREAVLGQSAFDPNDACSPPDKTFRLARAVVDVLERGREALATGKSFAELDLDSVRRALFAQRDRAPGDPAAQGAKGAEGAP